MATTHRLAPTPEEASVYTALTEYARERYAAGSLDRLAAGTLFRQAGSSAPALVRGLEGMAERRPADRKRLLELAEAARGISHHAKAEALGALLTRRPEKTIVFTFFRETLHMLEGALRQAGVSFATLSGEQTAAEKDRAVAEFQADRRVLLSTEVGSEGRNLQFCHALANFDLPWNPMRIEQRVGRVHRIGQKEEVLIDNFCARHTVEDYILRVLDAKLNMFELVIGEIGSILGNLEAEQEFDDLALDIWAAARDETEAAKGFDELADRLQEARERYQEAQELDEALFGGELATPAEAP